MLSKKLALLIVIAVSLVAFAGNAFAVPTNGDEVVRPVAGYGDDVAKYDFKWNEIPWIYVKDGNLKDYPYTEWHNPGNAVTHTFKEYDFINNPLPDGQDGNNKYGWFTPYAPSSWSSIRMAGAWTVYGVKGEGNGLSNPTTFNVAAAPEPISSALFLLGGGAIAVLKLRKKKV